MLFFTTDMEKSGYRFELPVAGVYSTRIFLLYKFIFLKLLPPLTEVFDYDSSSDPAG